MRPFNLCNPRGLVLGLGLGLSLGLAGCAGNWGGGQQVMFPYRANGDNSLNSNYADLDPQVTGRYLVYVSERRGSQDIFLFDLRDRRLVPLPGLNRFDRLVSHPSISEDGNWIVYAASQDRRTGIFLYRRDLQRTRNLVPTLQGEVRNPVISANGDRIAFEVSFNGQWDIALYDRQGRPLPIPGNAARP